MMGIVCPVIHQPSLTRWRMKGTTSWISVRPVLLKGDKAAAVENDLLGEVLAHGRTPFSIKSLAVE